jgi:hypothetical protein
MKVVLIAGLIIIFITSFFVLALGSSLAEESIACEELPYSTENVNCRIDKINMDVIVTFLMVVSFIIADVGAVYLMVTTWKA